MPTQPADVPVRHNEAENRFECEMDGHLAVAEYRLAADSITFTHTIVPGPLEGRGIGSALARCALDAARDRELKVVPQCAFIKTYIDRHPEYQDLVDGPGSVDR